MVKFLLLLACAALLPLLLRIQLRLLDRDGALPMRTIHKGNPAMQLQDVLPRKRKRYWSLILQGFLFMLPAWLFMPPWLVNQGYSILPVIALCAVNVVSSILTIHTLPPQDDEKYWLMDVREAVKNIAREGVNGANTVALHEGCHSPYAAARKAMIEGLVALGDLQCRKLLLELKDDPEMDIRASASEALTKMKPKPKPTLALAAMVNTYLQAPLTYYVMEKGLPIRALSGERLIAAIDEIVLSQGGLRAQYPHVLCKKCLEWAVAMEGGHWNWLECPNCRNATDLVGQVNKLVGWIGAMETAENDAGRYPFEVWDEVNHHVVVAPMQELYIHGGQAVNYDWAIATFLEKMMAQFPNNLKRLKVRIAGKPVLEANTLRLLRQYCAGVALL